MTRFTLLSGFTRRLRLPHGRHLFQLLTGSGVVLTVLALTACGHEDCITDSSPDIAGYRNPETGLCEGAGGGGGGVDCGGFGTGSGAQRALPDEAQCFGGCEGLDEQTCLATAACRGIYAGEQYVDCWGTAPSGPDSSLSCDGLDAWSCSRTDHCSAVHQDLGDGAIGVGAFVSCRDEKVGCYSDDECGGGSCSADTECLSPPGGGDLDVCYGFCEGNPPGGPGSCTGDIVCDQPPPECPEGTLPGRGSGCWTGYCIPLDRCDSLPACAELGEADCVSRSDCQASYRGQDCSCDDTGCTCAVYVFESCSG